MGIFDFLLSRQPQPRVPQITIEGDFPEQTIRAAADLANMAKSFRSFKDPLNTSVDTVLIPSILKNFQVEGRPPWKPLAQITVYKRGAKKGEKDARGAAHPILQDTGALIQAATSKEVWTITDTEAGVTQLDAVVPYAKYNQGGTGKMPARPFITFQDEDIEKMEAVFLAWMEELAYRKGKFRLG